MIPTRYPGCEASEDGQILMARKTEWRDLGDDRWAGLGQRVLVTDAGEVTCLSRAPDRVRSAAARRGPRARRLMAELTSQDRLQPSLLDRLIDDAPRSARSARRAHAHPAGSCAPRCCATCPGCSTRHGPSPSPTPCRRRRLQKWQACRTPREIGAELRHAGLFRRHPVVAGQRGTSERSVAQAISRLRAPHQRRQTFEWRSSTTRPAGQPRTRCSS